MQANKDGVEGNVTTTESEEMSHQQVV